MRIYLHIARNGTLTPSLSLKYTLFFHFVDGFGLETLRKHGRMGVNKSKGYTKWMKRKGRTIHYIMVKVKSNLFFGFAAIRLNPFSLSMYRLNSECKYFTCGHSSLSYNFSFLRDSCDYVICKTLYLWLPDTTWEIRKSIDMKSRN